LHQDVASGLEGLSMRMFTKILGWSREEVVELIEKVDVDLHSGKMHAYLPMYVCPGIVLSPTVDANHFCSDFLWARKPIESEAE
jgi:hypothetical protein